LQQGYAAGYLLGAVINLTVVTYSKYTWRSIYFIGAGFSLAAAIIRAFLPESRQFLLAREEAKASNMTSKQATKYFLREIGSMLKTNWIRCIWAVCMMTGECGRGREGADRLFLRPFRSLLFCNPMPTSVLMLSH
jgi:SHS family lactate transporter-like MFS transporter